MPRKSRGKASSRATSKLRVERLEDRVQPALQVASLAAFPAPSVGGILSGISDNGQYVAFVSNADNVTANDTNGQPDAFLYNRATGQTILVSKGLDGKAVGIGTYYYYAAGQDVKLSANGLFVLFKTPTNAALITTQKNNQNNQIVDPEFSTDLFRYDVLAGTTGLVSRNTNGDSSANSSYSSNIYDAAISDDGNVVAFSSYANDLVVGDTDSLQDVFAYRYSNNSMTRVNAAADGRVDQVRAVSGDGSTVVYTVLGSTTGATVYNLYLAPATGGATTLVSRDTGGAAVQLGSQSYGYGQVVSVSDDGQFVAFATDANGVVAADANNSLDTFLFDRTAGANVLVSRNSTGGAAGEPFFYSSNDLAVSGDGKFVAFTSSASNIVGNDSQFSTTDVFLFDRTAGSVGLVSRNSTGGALGDSVTGHLSISNDGRYVGFLAYPNYIAGGTGGNPYNPNVQAYVFDRLGTAVNQGITLASRSTGGGPSNGSVTDALLSGDGRSVAFNSNASDLTANYVSGHPDLFLFSATGPSVSLVTGRFGPPSATANAPSGLTSSPPDNYYSYSSAPPTQAVSDDGRYTVFVSRAGNLVGTAAAPLDTNNKPDAFLYDRITGTVTLISKGLDGKAAGLADYSYSNTGSVVISGDGNWIAFSSDAANIVPGDTNNTADVFLYNRSSGQITLVSHRNGGTAPATSYSGYSALAQSISDDGRFVAFSSGQSDLTGTLIQSFSQNNAYLYDRNSGQNVLVSRNSTGGALGVSTSYSNYAGDVAVSGDGSAVAFLSAPSAGTGPTVTQVFRFDRTAGSVGLVSRSTASATAGGSAASSSPMISNDGLIISFASQASDLAANDPNTADDLFLYNHAATSGQITLVSRGQDGKAAGVNTYFYYGSVPSRGFALSGDGKTAVFTTSASLLPADANTSSDVYLFNRTAGTTTLVSRTPTGVSPQYSNSFGPSVSDDGGVVTFASNGQDLTSTNSNPDYDYYNQVYSFDRVSNYVGLLTRTAAGDRGNNGSDGAVVSGNGRVAAFVSQATNFVAADTNAAADLVTVTIDPLVTVGPVASPRLTPVSSIPITFIAKVNGFDLGDLTLTRDTGSGPVVVPLTDPGITLTAADNQNYTLAGLPAGLTSPEGVYVLTVTGAGITFQANGQVLPGNGAGAFAVDLTSPTVSYTYGNPSPGGSITLFVNFSEPVTGVDATDFQFAVTGGLTLGSVAVTDVSGGGAFWTVTATTGPGEGTIRLDVRNDGTIKDVAGNALAGPLFTAGAPAAVDRTAPTVVSITRESGNPSGGVPVSYLVKFSEPISYNFSSFYLDATDFTVTSTGITGTVAVTNIQYVSDDTYRVVVSTGTAGNGTVTLSLVDDDTIKDLAGNPLGGAGAGNGAFAGGADQTFTVDRTRPSVASVTRANPNPTNAGSVAFTVAFTKPVVGVDATDFAAAAVGLGGTPAVTNVVASADRITYTVTLSTGTGDGTLGLTVLNDGTIKDDTDQLLLATTNANPLYDIDRTAPFVSVDTLVTPSNSPTVTGTVFGAAAVKVTVNGGQKDALINFSTGTWSVAFGPLADGVYPVTAVATDAAGNSTTDATTNELVVGNVPFVQSVNRANTDPTTATSVDFTVTFSQSVTGVDATDFVLTTSGVSGSSITSVSGSGTTYTVTVATGTGNGTIRLDVLDDDTIKNIADLTLAAGFTAGQSYTIDRQAPTVTSSVPSVGGMTNAGSVSFTVTFSESVTGVDAGDFALTTSGVSGASVTNVTGSGSVYTVTVATGTGDGTIRVDVADNDTITDAAGNLLGGLGTGNGDFTAGTPASLDKTAPTVTGDIGTSPTAVNTPTVTFSATDAGAGVVGATAIVDVDLNNDGDFADANETAFASALLSAGSVTLPTLPDGTVGIRVRVVDAAGNIGVSTTSLLVVDTAAPTVGLTAPAATNILTPTVSVTVTDGGSGTTASATIDVDLNNDGDFADTGETGYATVALTGGTGSTVLPALPSDGTYRVRARTADAVGNAGVSTTSTVVVDTTAPTVGVSVAAAVGTRTPTVGVTVTDAGAGPGTSAALDVDLNNDGDFDDANETGYATVALTAGSGSVALPALPADGTYRVRARASDAAGNAGTSAAGTFLVDTVAPDVTLTVNVSSPTADSTPSVTVTASDASSGLGANPTAFIDVDKNNDGDFLDAGETGYASSALTGGTATFDLPALADGTVAIRARVSDAAGVAGISTFQSLLVDTTAPTVVASVSTPTNTLTPTVSVTVTDGGSGPGTTATLDVDLNNDGDFSDANETGYATVALTGGVGSVALPALPADGTYRVRARASDAVGNAGTSAAVTFVADTTAPTVTGVIAAVTNSANPSVAVTATDAGAGFAAGVVAAVDVDLNNDGDFADTGETGYSTAALTVTAGSATGSVPLAPALADGVYGVRVRVSDAAGNAGTSATSSVRVDTTAPTVTLTGPASPANSRTVSVGVSASDAGAGVAGTQAVVDVDLNNDGDFSDAGEAGFASGPLANGTVSVTLPADGTVRFRARVTDAAGNTGTSAAATALIDTVAPTVALTAPALTNDLTPSVGVTVTDTGSGAGASITVDVDLNNDGDFADPGELGYAGSSLADTIGQIVPPQTRNWTLDLPPLPGDGTYRVRVRGADAAGNVGTSTTATLVVDATPPVAPVISGVTPDTGSSATDRITSATALTLAGTAETGSTVVVTRAGAGVIGQVTAGANGTWTLAVPAPLANGQFQFTATATDPAGNTGPASAAFAVTVDTVAPAAPANLAFTATGGVVSGLTTSATAGVVAGTAEAGSTVSVFDGLTQLGTTTAGADGAWSLVVAGLAEGRHLFSARATDAAGNLGLASAPVAVTVDTTGPTTTVAPAAGQANPASAGPVLFTVTFSEPVAGFDATDIVLGGTAGATTATVTGSGTTYTVAVTGMTTAGSVFVAVAAGAAADAVGNASAAVEAAGVAFDPAAPPPTGGGTNLIAVGTGPGSNGTITVVNGTTGQTIFSLAPYGENYAGGVRGTVGQLTGDSTPDLVTANGPGAAAVIKVFDGATGQLVREVANYEASYTGGAFVATADLNGDGVSDLVVSTDNGGGPRVRVLDGATMNVMADFFAIDDPDFRGGVRVALADLNGDGIADLIAGAGFGGGPRVAIFDGASILAGVPARLVPDFFVFEQTLRDGVYVAAGDVDGDGTADVIFGAGSGGAPRVFGLDGAALVAGNSVPVADFFAGDPATRGGARVAVKDLDGDRFADLVVGTGARTAATVSRYLGSTITPSGTPPLFEDPLDMGDDASGVFVG